MNIVKINQRLMELTGAKRSALFMVFDYPNHQALIRWMADDKAVAFSLTGFQLPHPEDADLMPAVETWRAGMPHQDHQGEYERMRQANRDTRGSMWCEERIADDEAPE